MFIGGENRRKMGKLINKNNIWKDKDGNWNLELFQYMENGKPMYSFFDSFQTEKEAVKVAKTLNRNNEDKIRNKLMENPKYFK